jgi:hypothetical protein
MQKVVIEDWSFFNQAVRERAEGKPRANAPLKLLTPEPPTPAPGSLRSPLGTAPVVELPSFPARPQVVNAAAPARPAKDDNVFVFVGRFLLGVVGLLVLLAILGIFGGLFGSSQRTATVAVTGTGTGGLAGNEAVVTNFTQFNTVRDGEWNVVTGWNFARSGDAVPTTQYCYMENTTAAGKSRYDLETRSANGARMPLTRPDALVPGLNDSVWAEASAKCQWYH